jgi:hypothetical protein
VVRRFFWEGSVSVGLGLGLRVFDAVAGVGSSTRCLVRFPGVVSSMLSGSVGAARLRLKGSGVGSCRAGGMDSCVSGAGSDR